MTRQFFEPSAPRGPFLAKTKKNLPFRYGLGECVYQILGLYRFSFGQGVVTQPNKKTNEHRNMMKYSYPDPIPPPSRVFDFTGLGNSINHF